NIQIPRYRVRSKGARVHYARAAVRAGAADFPAWTRGHARASTDRTAVRVGSPAAGHPFLGHGNKRHRPAAASRRRLAPPRPHGRECGPAEESTRCLAASLRACARAQIRTSARPARPDSLATGRGWTIAAVGNAGGPSTSLAAAPRLALVAAYVRWHAENRDRK